MTEPVVWRRPHPLTVVVLVVTFVGGNAGPLVVAVALGGGGLGFDTVAVVIGALTVGSGVLGWYMTGYALTDDAVHYRSGVLNRQSRSISLARVQQVSVVEPVVARAVGLAVVQVAEASADGDIEIRFLGKDDAAALTQRLRSLARRDDAAPGEVGSSLPPPPEPPAVLLHTATAAALVRYHLGSSAPGFLASAVVAAVVIAVVALGAGVAAAAPVALVAAGTIALAVVASTIGTVLTNGDFRLERSSRALRVEAGLLSRRQIEVRPERIQTLTVTSGPVVRRMGLHQIAFSAATGKVGRQDQSIQHLAPVADERDVARIVQGSADVDPAFGVELEAVSVHTVRRQLVRGAIAYALVVVPGSVALWFVHPVGAVLPTLVYWPGVVWHARERFRRLGLTVDGRRMVVRGGVFVHQLTQIPLGHIQSVATSASFFQRRLGLCSLEVTTAGVGPGNHVSVPDLPAARADALARELAAVAATTRWELRS